ncbi:MAG: hypothetical protein KL801_15940 [Mesorhizobium sp.]|nr:hypothetical protein [Mesorhizobium sp.]
MRHKDQNTSSNDAPPKPEPAPLSTYFVKDRFLPEKAVERLLSEPPSEYGEASILMTGLMCWIMAPEKPEFLKWKLLDFAERLLERERKKIAKSLYKKRRGGSDFILMLAPRTKWVYAAFEDLVGRGGLREIPSREELLNTTIKQMRYAAYAGDVVSAIHRHVSHVSQKGRKYGRASVRKSHGVVEKLLQCKSPLLVGNEIGVSGKPVRKAETIRTEIWAPRRATVAWCYALNVFFLDNLPLAVKVAESGKLPKRLARDKVKLANLAGIALFVQEQVLPHLPEDAKEALPKFEYPASLKAVPFSPTEYSIEELAHILPVSVDHRWAGGSV